MTEPGPPCGLRILFFLLHPGYLRYFAPLVSELAVRGHAVHLAFSRLEKDPGDLILAEQLATAHPRVTHGLAPSRAELDGWRPLAGLLRSLTDIVRFTGPRFADAPALRERATVRLTDHARAARIDPVTRRAVIATIGWLARPIGEKAARRRLRVLAALERLIPTAGAVDNYLADRRPDVVLVSPVVELGSSQVEMVKSGLRAGIPTGICVASWDNLTMKGHLRVVPHRVFVWNEIQAREAAELHGVPPQQIAVTGSPKFDRWFGRSASTSREEFAKKVGLNPQAPFLLYTCSSGFIAPEEVPFVLDWIGWLRASGSPALEQVGVMVRPHPQNAAQWEGVVLPERVIVFPRGGAQPDDDVRGGDFFDSLWHSSAVVGVNTSALIEAGIVGRAVLAVADPRFARTQEGTVHFRYLLEENGGFVRLARSPEEHLLQLEQALASTADEMDRTRAFVASFVRPHGLDRPATPLLADAIEALAVTPTAPARTTPATRTLRAMLRPVVALAGTAMRLGRADSFTPRR